MKTILFFDIESTGLNIVTDRIIQLSMIKTDIAMEIIEKKKLLLSNCGVPIQKEAFEEHGISEDVLKDCAPFQSYAHKIHSYFESCDYIAGYNIKGFDIYMLYEEFYRAGINWIPKPAIDSCVIFKQREKRNLSAALKFYTGEEMVDAHDAENDVLATIKILVGQIEHYDLGWIRNSITEEIDENPKPIDEILIEESKYENEDRKLSFDGKLILSDQGIPIFNFGKLKGQPIKSADLGYINWILGGDFSNQTKNVLRSLINS